MKKYVYLSAIVAAGLSSCAQNEIESVPALDQDNAIGFSAYSGLTRGQEMDIDMLKENGFGLFGYYHGYTGKGDAASWLNERVNRRGADFMNNQKLSYDANAIGTIGNWVYSPIKYWPNNTKDRVSFIAYAPYVDLKDGSSNQSEGIIYIDAADLTQEDSYPTSKTPTIHYRLHEYAADMIDLVGASSFDQGKLADKYNNSKYYENCVDLQFKHLLTRVHLHAILDGQIVDDINSDQKGTEVFITKLMLVGPENETLVNKDGKVEKGGAFFNEGKFTYNVMPEEDEAIGYWEGLGYTAEEENYDLDKKTNFLRFSYITRTNYKTRGMKVGIESSPLMVNGESLYLLPPNGMEGVTTDNKVKLYVEYDVVSYDKKLPNGGRAVVTNKDIVDFTTGSLKMGTSYKVNLKINLTSVDASADVSPWEEDEYGTVTPGDVYEN